MINICLDEKLREILNENNIDIKDYIPAYNGESAGLDLYNSGKTKHVSPLSKRYIVLGKNNESASLQIPTGLRINVPKGYVALIKERGSISKTPLKIRAGVIDSGYTGEIFVNCINVGQDVYTIYEKAKLPFQIIVVKCDNNFNIISNKEYSDLVSEAKRKSGKIGSSD